MDRRHHHLQTVVMICYSQKAENARAETRCSIATLSSNPATLERLLHAAVRFCSHCRPLLCRFF
jgi:hypothetical protein